MPRQKLIPDLEALARKYRVTTRTILRWHHSGVDVHSLESVGTLLLKQRNPSLATLETITENTDEHI